MAPQSSVVCMQEHSASSSLPAARGLQGRCVGINAVTMPGSRGGRKRIFAGECAHHLNQF